MPLDPIVSLSVAIAEAPGSHAFLLGSGVSRDAGVPTGQDVYWQAVGELYRLELATEEEPEREALASWLEETHGKDIGYSGVLELIAPDQGTRRDYLAKHFEGVEPGRVHHRLAELAERKLVRVFVTTNFDRLLEHALQARGIEPVVVTSATSLQAAQRREHSPCYVLKPHGDYLQETIRNTAEELEELDGHITAELREVFDRYGVVVIGYSGSDRAVGDALRQRKSRYGFYWVARASLSPSAQSIVEDVGGRVLHREGASEFLDDLDVRLRVFEKHPSGHTPLSINDEVMTQLRRGDAVGLVELMRRERRAFAAAFNEHISSNRQKQPTADLAAQAHDELLPALERRAASMLPLVLYDEAQLTSELRAVGETQEKQPIDGGYTFWPELRVWGTWWISFVLGALAVRTANWQALRSLFRLEIVDPYGGVKPLFTTIPGSAAASIGTAVMARLDETRWLSASWESLQVDIRESEIIARRYPELIDAPDKPLTSLTDFDFIATLVSGLQDRRRIAHWAMYHNGAESLARRLHADLDLRSQLADAVGLSLEDFDTRVPAEAFDGMHVPGFQESSASKILIDGHS